MLCACLRCFPAKLKSLLGVTGKEHKWPCRKAQGRGRRHQFIVRERRDNNSEGGGRERRTISGSRDLKKSKKWDWDKGQQQEKKGTSLIMRGTKLTGHRTERWRKTKREELVLIQVEKTKLLHFNSLAMVHALHPHSSTEKGVADEDTAVAVLEPN